MQILKLRNILKFIKKNKNKYKYIGIVVAVYNMVFLYLVETNIVFTNNRLYNVLNIKYIIHNIQWKDNVEYISLRIRGYNLI